MFADVSEEPSALVIRVEGAIFIVTAVRTSDLT
jgi:hypothetical protein